MPDVAMSVTSYDGGQLTTAAATATQNSTFVGPVELGARYRRALYVANGATNNCVFTVEGSFDGTNWFTIGTGEGAAPTYAVTAITATANQKRYLFLQPEYYRFVRVNVSTGNANGTSFRFFAE